MQLVRYLKCKDSGLFPQCHQMIEGQNEEEVVVKAKAHAKEHHGRDLTENDIIELRKHIIEKTVSC
jgi:predicted small metal-binding protein